MAWVLLPWITGMYYHSTGFSLVQNSIQAFLSIIPNRWLVFSRSSFWVFLILAVLPLNVFLRADFTHVDILTLLACLPVAVVLFAPLPLSLIFSRIRLCRGEKLIYA